MQFNSIIIGDICNDISLPEQFSNLLLLVLLCGGDDALLEEETVVLVELEVRLGFLARSRKPYL